MGDLDAAVISETTAIAEIVTSQVALDITLLTQRTGRDIEGVMAKMLGPRVGRLDTLLTKRDEGRAAEGHRRRRRRPGTAGEGVPVSRSVRGDAGSPASMPPKSIAPLGSMAPRSIPPGPGDAYSDLLRDTRGLRREQSHARDQWLARLPENRTTRRSSSSRSC